MVEGTVSESRVASERLVAHLVHLIVQGAQIEYAEGSEEHKAFNRLANALDKDIKGFGDSDFKAAASELVGELTLASEEFREALYEIVHLIWKEEP